MTKQNYIVTSIVDGQEKHYTVHNVCKNKVKQVAINVAEKMFCGNFITIKDIIII